jgi:tRNA pseudouridine55 synthase
MSDGAVAPSATALGGVLLLDKAAGISSFQALRPVKRAFPKTKIGHAGTLDPAATGLLLVGVGSGTRLLEYLEGMPKTYSFIARFGIVSDSYDMESPVTPAEGEAAQKAMDLDRATVEKALAAFRGPISQVPPSYSAIKIEGERACDRVRAGEEVALAARNVTVHSLELKSFAPFASPSGNTEATLADGSGAAAVPAYASASFEMTCSKGTYVRSLVHDLGRALGCGGVTDKIRRLAIGPFNVAEAGESLSLLPLDTAVIHLPRAILGPAGVAYFLVGRAVDPAGYALPDAGPSQSSSPSTFLSGSGSGAPQNGCEQEYRALDESGRLLAIATLSPEGLLCPKKVLVRN